MRYYNFKLLVYITQRAIVVENRPKVCPFIIPVSNMDIFYVKNLHLVASTVVGGGFGCKGMVEEQLEERETLRKVSEANHWFQIEQLMADLGTEKATSQMLENSRMMLERQNKELKLKLQDIESSQRAKSKTAIASLESKLAQLEEQLEEETREKQNIAKSSRKLEKHVKELLLQLDDERRHADQYKEQYLEKEGVSVTLEDIGKQTMPDGSILPLPPILLGTSGNDPKKKTVCIYGHLDVQPAALYCAQIWLGKYDSKSGEADFSTPDKRREFMRLKYEEKKFYVDPREAIKKMKPPGPVAPTSALLLSLGPKATL